MLELARRRVPAAETHHAALPDLPFAAGSFDAAVANFVVNHVGDPAAALGELRRVVRPTDLPRLAPDKEFPRTCDGLTELLRRAGLTDAGCDQHTAAFRDADGHLALPTAALLASASVD